MRKTMHGVNLGGWLVLEKWLTPWVFEGTDAEDEYVLMHTKNARQRLEEHRAQYVTAEDWQWLAAQGVSFVRLPIGYWALGGEAPFLNAQKYIDWAMESAAKHGIKILLDIHAVKGSQSGEMHSGKEGRVDWWRYRQESLDFLERIARRYGKHPALWGIEIMNEPKVFGYYWKLLWYYRKAYAVLRQHIKPGVRTVFSDGYVGPLLAGALLLRKGYPVVMDSHYYLLFGKWLSWMEPLPYDKLRAFVYTTSIRFCSLWQPVIVGEWSSVLPRPMLDKIPESQHLKTLHDTIMRQRHMYRYATHTAYWNYKANGPGMYNYKSMVDENVITP